MPLQHAETAVARPEEATFDCLLTKAEVLKVTGWSDTTLWREAKAKRFPTPVPTSRARIGWLKSEVEAWLKDRIAARDARVAA
jgi:prophage regulatory protein